MSEHVLIFGNGYYVPDRLRTWARNAGQSVSTTVICDPEQMVKIDEPEKLARIVVLPAGASIEEWVAFARLVHQLQPVTRIGTFSDQGQVAAAAAGRALGIATHSVETVRLVHDKYAMRQRLAEAGVESTASAVVRDVAELREFAAAHGYPCVVKPGSGMASAGVSIISGPDEAQAAFDRAHGISHDRGLAPALATAPALAAGGPDQHADNPIQVIAEQYLTGVQYSVECFSEQGEHQLVTITRKYSDPVSLVELGHVMPAPLEQAEQEAIGAHVGRALEALGVEFGPTHTEIVLTGAGPRIIETHLRFGGDHIWDLVTDATGVDLVKNQWRQMIGEKVLPGIRETLRDEDRPRRCQAIWFASTQASGVLVEITGVEGPHPDGVTVKYPLPAGTEVHGLQSSFSRLAQARAAADTAAEAVELARQAVEGLGVVVRVPSTVPEVI